VIAEKLFTTLGCEVTMLYDNVDGNFPDHHPDPGDVENMQALIAMVTEKGADLGIAFDGDGDRLGVVDSQGNLIAPDRLLMLLAADLLMHNPGVDVIYDVKSSKALAGHILASGGNPVMWKSGHSLMKAKLRESGALLAGEYSGHIFYAERWYGFDDALYSAVRLLEILSAEGRTSAEVFAALPNPLSTPEIRVAVEDGTQQTLMETIQSQALVLFGDARIVDIDGIRAEYANGWGLVRASNTTPYLTLRFEADDENAMNDIKDNFRSVLSMVLPDASISF
jgi:phosphomannomutase/phosphoglucomutase